MTAHPLEVPEASRGTGRAATYARVATHGQEDPNAALDRQIAACTDYCTAHAYIVVDRYADAGYSGNTAQRPALQRLLRSAEAGRLDLVLVADLARIARDTRVLAATVERLERAGVALVIVDRAIDSRTPEGRAMLTLLV